MEQMWYKERELIRCDEIDTKYCQISEIQGKQWLCGRVNSVKSIAPADCGSSLGRTVQMQIKERESYGKTLHEQKFIESNPFYATKQLIFFFPAFGRLYLYIHQY
eukprot:514039_1